MSSVRCQRRIVGIGRRATHPKSAVRAQVNKIRESLGRVVRNSTAAGLRQPHLERTRLCELSDAELDPVYVRQRDALRGTVRQLARPKSVNGQARRTPLVCPTPDRIS